METPSDEGVLDTARRCGFLDEKQVREILALRRDEPGDPPMPIGDFLAQAGYLGSDQVRAVVVTARYEDGHHQDSELGAFLVSNGFLKEDVVRKCLAQQDAPFLHGEEYPRLHEIIAEQKLLSPEHVKLVLKTRAQMEETRRRMLAGGAEIARKPTTRRMETAKFSLDPENPAPVARVEPAKPPGAVRRTLAKPMVTEDFDFKKHKNGVVLSDNLKVAVRPTRIKDQKGGEVVVTIIELHGSVDPASAPLLTGYLAQILNDGKPNLLISGPKLTQISAPAVQGFSQLAERCRQRGGDLRICEISDGVRRSLEGATDVKLKLYDAERGAAMSFKYM